MITILNSYSGNSMGEGFFSILFLLLIVAVDVGFCAHASYMGDEDYLAGFIMNLIIVAILAVVMGADIYFESRTQYHEAIISPDVPFVEVMKHYEIDRKRGDIWILSEPKEDER